MQTSLRLCMRLGAAFVYALLVSCGTASNTQTTESPAPDYYVDAAALQGGDGSAERPFPSLAVALAQAEKDERSEAGIAVAAGLYPEGLLRVPLPVRITGAGGQTVIAGSFEVAGSLLSLTDLSIIDSDGIAVAVKRKDADVTLVGVEITGAFGYGVRQIGGRLTIHLVTISGTAAESADPASGTAIFVGGGTQLELGVVHLHHNVRGLHAGGVGTRVDADLLLVENSGYHPSVLEWITTVGCDIGFDYLGAVEFADGAIGVGSNWTITDSTIAGLYAHGGARVTVRDLTILRTLSLYPTAPGAPCSSVGGFGAVAHAAGELDISYFRIIGADLCGVNVGSLPGTAIDLAYGVISSAPIGACVALEGFDTSRLMRFVRYADVGVPLRAPSYDFPDPP
ncbi:MAG: hypothetical protein ACC662_00100 [Planctomycetota bacterium]